MGAVVIGILALLLVGNVIPDPLAPGQWRGGARPDAGFATRIAAQLQSFGFYFQDNFGFRATLPAARLRLREEIASPDTRHGYLGRDGQMFWAGEQAPEQSAGQVLRAKAVTRFVDLVAAVQAGLSSLGTVVVVAVPPNAQSVDTAFLPGWNDQTAARATEYGLLLEELHARDVRAADLKVALSASPEPRRYRPNDTHWTELSSTIAFNATMVAMGRPDWQVPLAKVVGPATPVPPGDLARALKRPPVLPEMNHPLAFRTTPAEHPHPALRLGAGKSYFRSYAITYGQTGPRVLIVGDSFTVNTWARLLSHAPVSQVGWMHFSPDPLRRCEFDFDDVVQFRPDYLIFAPAERFFPCPPDGWPLNLPPPSPAGEAEAGRSRKS